MTQPAAIEEAASFEVRVLGPLEVVRGATVVRVGGPRERALLTLLAAHAGQVVPVDRLVEGLWGDDAPATATKTLQTYVAHLRKALEQAEPGGRDRLRTVAGGYLLHVAPEELDVWRFERLSAEAREALASGQVANAAAAFRKALDLWRGGALGDLGANGHAATEIVRLEEARIEALEGRIEADLALGRHHELAGELQALVDRHPLRESLWSRLMLALYRCGRQAEALQAYQRARALLVEDLGIEPGSNLQKLQLRILQQDPTLDWTPHDPATPTAGVDGLLETARAAHARFDWTAGYEAFTAADAIAPLAAADLERLAECAWWNGRGAESAAAHERAYEAFTRDGAELDAARMAIALAEDHVHLLAPAVAQGWVARAERLLEGSAATIERGHLLRVRTTMTFDVDGDAERGLDLARRTRETGRVAGDRDLEVIGLQDEGRILVSMGRLDEGMALIDEAMAAAVGAELGPYVTGVAYCNTIITCESLADYRRAGDWTDAMLRWCERHARSGFPGVCRVFQAEILRLRGHWAEAEETARRAAAELESVVPYYAGEGMYEAGETRRRMGDLAGAEEAFGRAHAFGRDPCPGLALVRLAQGAVDAASALIAEAVGGHRGHPLNRMRCLPAQVEIALAARDIELALAASEDMRDIAGRFGSPVMAAACAQAEGALALAQDQPRAAIESLRRAVRLWREADLPYETARAQALLSRAYAAVGDAEHARLEANAAASTFERLGAVRDLAAIRN